MRLTIKELGFLLIGLFIISIVFPMFISTDLFIEYVIAFSIFSLLMSIVAFINYWVCMRKE